MSETWSSVQNSLRSHVWSPPCLGPLHQLKQLLYLFEQWRPVTITNTWDSEQRLTRNFSEHIATRWMHTYWQAAMRVTNTKLWMLQSARHTCATMSLVHRLFGRHTHQNSLVFQQHLQEQASQKAWQQRSTTYTQHKLHGYVSTIHKQQLKSGHYVSINSTFGDRSFAVAGARIWNSLPSSLRSADLSTEWFKRALKMFLFVWDRGATVTFLLKARRI